MTGKRPSGGTGRPNTEANTNNMKKANVAPPQTSPATRADLGGGGGEGGTGGGVTGFCPALFWFGENGWAAMWSFSRIE